MSTGEQSNGPGQTEVTGLTVQDVNTALQLIHRFLKMGDVKAPELLPLGLLYTNLARSFYNATGIDFETLQAAQIAQAQQAAQAGGASTPINQASTPVASEAPVGQTEASEGF